MKIKKIITTIILTATICSSQLINIQNTFATPTNSNNNYRTIQKQIKDNEEEIVKLDNNIETLMHDIDKNNKDLKKITKEIDLTHKELIQKKKELEETTKLSEKRLVYLYQVGNTDIIEVILSSENITDLFQKMNYLKDIASYDKKIIKKIEFEKKDIEKKEKSLSENKTKLIQIKNTNDKKLKDLNSKKQKQQDNLKILNEKKEKCLNEIRRTAITYSTPQLSRGIKFTGSNNNVVNLASQFQGVPYVWGGTSPSGFDCSGLVQYVYGSVGVGLPRVSQDQQNVGQNVPLNELQPGDLVFFGNPAHHVGIYAGNGTMIHAPHTGDVVKFAPLNYNKVTNAKRVR